MAMNPISLDTTRPEQGTPLDLSARRPPPLESGDRLTRREFERRYEAMPSLKKAELIEGVVYVSSPLKFESHAEPHTSIITWLSVYRLSTPGTRIGDNATVKLDEDNEVQRSKVCIVQSAPHSPALRRLPSNF